MFNLNQQIGTKEIIFIILFLVCLILFKSLIKILVTVLTAKYSPKKEPFERSQKYTDIIESSGDPFGEQPPFDDTRYNNERRAEVISEAQRRHNETILNHFGYIKRTCNKCGKIHLGNFDECDECINRRLN